jgi:ribose 5-phosphate isomerase B
MLYLAADHAGLELKDYVAHKLAAEGIAYEDFGTFSPDPNDDYPKFARMLARAVAKSNGRGLMFCGSGEGMAIVANRLKGIRAAVVWKKEIAVEAREDNDANVASLPTRFISREEGWEIVRAFLATSFSHEARHKRRISQIDHES